LLRAWIDAVLSTNHRLSDKSIELLSKDINLLLNSLDYIGFSQKLLCWAEFFRDTSLGDNNTYNEFIEDSNVWNMLISQISRKFEGEDVGLHQFLNELDLNSKTPPKPSGAISCFTIHASKGMEFGHVYLMGLVEDQLPIWPAVLASKYSNDNCPEMQEERRNCFVAITRAQKSLTLTLSKNVFGWPKRPSRFLKEMGFNLP
jgi:DNA helicase-2/ATP-dependent DNA helicase PcrA